MKLLSFAYMRHDQNVSYFDGERVRYHKFERTKQVKRFKFTAFWELERELKDLWNIKFDDMDDIAIFYSDTNGPCQHDTSTPYTRFSNGESSFNIKTGWFLNHHYAHALSANMFMEQEPSVSFIIDGFGDYKTWSVFKKDTLIDCGSIDNGSIGYSMSKMGEYLGIEAMQRGDIAGKLMAMQSYGDIDQNYLNELRKLSIVEINDIFNPERWNRYKGDQLLGKLTSLDWARTVHVRIEELILDLFRKYAKEDEYISYSGGVAQNVVWNTTLKKHFRNLFVIPHAGDEGLSLGGLEFLRRYHNLPKFNIGNFPYIQNDHTPDSIPTDETIKHTARLLAEGKTVAWYQGNGEAGPRALGNRSILMHPCIPYGKEKINRIKNRENYRPFGASVLEEYVDDYFDLGWKDECMLYTAKVKTDIFPAITHIDGTCRLQTVGGDNHFRKLLEEFYSLTGYPVLLNTSMNLAGKPIAGYPEIAIQLLKTTPLDHCVIGDKIYEKPGRIMNV